MLTAAELRIVIGVEEYPETTPAYADSILDTFIADATLLITEGLSGKGLSAERMELITKYLAAHFASLTFERGQITFAKTGDASEYYGFKAGQGLLSSRYGQQAVSLDTSGTLASQASPNSRAEFKLIATNDDSSNINDGIWD